LTDLQTLAPAAILLVLGAMSPGPSLAVVVRNTMTGGRWQGIRCAVGHGLGFGLYALAVIFGLAVVMREAPAVFTITQALGALLLLYLAWQSFKAPTTVSQGEAGKVSRGFTEGFLVAILNPKIAVFFLAVFSSVLADELGIRTRFTMAGVGWLIDTLWYVLVAALLSTGPPLAFLHRQARPINIAMAVIFLALAIVTMARTAREVVSM